MDQIIKKIKLVFDLKPDTVFNQIKGDVHSDHVIAKASLACCKTFRNKNIKKFFYMKLYQKPILTFGKKII